MDVKGLLKKSYERVSEARGYYSKSVLTDLTEIDLISYYVHKAIIYSNMSFRVVSTKKALRLTRKANRALMMVKEPLIPKLLRNSQRGLLNLTENPKQPIS